MNTLVPLVLTNNTFAVVRKLSLAVVAPKKRIVGLSLVRNKDCGERWSSGVK